MLAELYRLLDCRHIDLSQLSRCSCYHSTLLLFVRQSLGDHPQTKKMGMNTLQSVGQLTVQHNSQKTIRKAVSTTIPTRHLGANSEQFWRTKYAKACAEV